MRFYRNTAALIFTTVLLLVLSIVVLFDNSSDGNITGYDIVNTKVEIFPTQLRNCSFDLHPGWNMVSFYCFGMYVERSRALQSIEGSYDAVFEYQSNDVNDPWKSYTTNSLPNWTIQQLNYMDRVSGYWLYALNDTTFNYSGIYSDSNIYLYTGWNFVGYPVNIANNISESLINISYSMVKYYNTTDGMWLVYLYTGSNNTLNQFESYKGYWLNISGDQQWKLTRG